MSVEISKESKYTLKYDPNDLAVPVIHECICDLQANLAQYFTISTTKHMKLKETFKNEEADENVKAAYDELNDFLNENIETVFEIAQKHLDKYYYGRTHYHPRITIKAPYEEAYIVDLFRKDRSPYSRFKAKENTAFKYIKDTGKFYLCNDIPNAVFNELYENKRINGKMLRNSYKLPHMGKKLLNSLTGQAENDPAWENLWDTQNKEERPHTESCYKSTLVIPMTLINATLCKDFKNYIAEETGTIEQGDKYKKLMFGFLCLDHRHTDYFNYESDIRIGYIISDMLSLFLITRMMCTIKSRTYNKARELVG